MQKIQGEKVILTKEEWEYYRSALLFAISRGFKTQVFNKKGKISGSQG